MSAIQGEFSGEDKMNHYREPKVLIMRPGTERPFPRQSSVSLGEPISEETRQHLKKCAEEWNREDEEERLRRGGLISPPPPGCNHDWQPCEYFENAGLFFVKKCSKCHVLGIPPGG
jgi:hypothetical protein